MSAHLNVAERRELNAYIRELADLMGLRDWTFDLAAQPSKSDTYASIHCVHGQRHAKLKLCREFRTLTPAYQRATLVHELVHCHVEDADELARTLATEELGRQAAKTFERAFELALEHAVDGIAEAWAPKLPACTLARPTGV